MDSHGLSPSEQQEGWTPRRLRALGGRPCQALDLVLLGSVLLGLVGLPFVAHPLGGLGEFLQLRVSLRNLAMAFVCVAIWRVILVSVGVYSPQRTRSLNDYMFRCLIALNCCAVVVAGVEALLGAQAGLWRIVAVYWMVSLVLMMASRTVLIGFDRLMRPLMRRDRNLIIVGSGERARKVYEDFKAHTEWDYTLVGFVDSEPQGGFVPPELILGGIDKLEQILMHTVVDEVVIALPMKSQHEVIGHVIQTCQMLGVQSQYFTDYFGTAVTKRRVDADHESGRVRLEVVTADYRLLLKRVFDVVFSVTALVLLSPVLLAVAIAVKVTSPGPVLFLQKRFGLNKRTFWMLKFRSMCVDAEARQAAIEHMNETAGPAFKIKHDPRVTSIGNFIRKTSLDELPQLFNVMMGDMSMVGPRPLPLRDVSKFPEAWLMRRFSVKPGVTCLWQISGRSNIDFDGWIELDLQYIDNWSLSLDLLILLKTFPSVLMSRGAS